MASSAIISGHRGRPALRLRRRLHLLAAILPGLGTRAMRQHGLATVRAGADVGCDRLPLGAPLVPLLPAGSLLRNAHSLLLLLQLDALQGRPARIDEAAVAAARTFIEVLAARRAEAETILPAEWRRGDVQEDLLADRRREIDLLSRVRVFIHQPGIEAGLGIVAASLSRSMRLLLGPVGAGELDRFAEPHQSQAPLALPHERHVEPGLYEH